MFPYTPSAHIVETKPSEYHFHGSNSLPLGFVIHLLFTSSLIYIKSLLTTNRSTKSCQDGKSLSHSTLASGGEYASRPYHYTQRQAVYPILIDNILGLPLLPPRPQDPTVMADTGSADEGWAAWAVQEDFEKVVVNLSRTVDLPLPVLHEPPTAQRPILAAKVGSNCLHRQPRFELRDGRRVLVISVNNWIARK